MPQIKAQKRSFPVLLGSRKIDWRKQTSQRMNKCIQVAPPALRTLQSCPAGKKQNPSIFLKLGNHVYMALWTLLEARSCFNLSEVGQPCLHGINIACSQKLTVESRSSPECACVYDRERLTGEARTANLLRSRRRWNSPRAQESSHRSARACAQEPCLLHHAPVEVVEVHV